MTIVTTYTCDKCGHSQEDAKSPRQMWSLEVAVKRMENKTYSAPFVNKGGITWCRECVIATGVVEPAKDEETPTSPLTLEDLIREIIQEEIEAGQ